jgi:hypothetical protein
MYVETGLYVTSVRIISSMDSEQQTKSNSKSPRGPDAAPDGITTSIDTVPITLQRKPYQPGGENPKLAHAGTYPRDTQVTKAFTDIVEGVARANLAATHERPGGTTEGDWAHKHRHQTVRTQACVPFEPIVTLQIGSSATLRLLR